jgi:hypothetical protein
MYNPKFSPIDAHDTLLHGWDARAESWHGPIPLAPSRGGARQTSRVRAAQGGFQGKLRCSVPGLPCVEFHTSVYDLRDTGLVVVHLDGAQARPAGILAVVPSNRHHLL